MADRMERGISRRTFLELGAGAVLVAPALLASCGDGGGSAQPDGAVALAWDPEALAEDAGRFPLGVQAGAMRAESALLWTKAEGVAEPHLRVWREGDWPGSVWLVVDQPVAPTDGYVKVSVEGLAADTRYRYAFLAPDAAGDPAARSVIRAFRTAFPPGHRAPLVLGTTSCSHWARQPWRSLEQAAAWDLHAFCHLGDFAYNDEAVTREEYRALWAEVLTDPGYRALLPAVGMYATLDDHEVANNFSNDPDFPDERLRAGLEAFFETVAVPRLGGDRLWDSYRWGDTAEIFVLDTRTERRPETRLGPDAEYISTEQLAWLTDGLRASPCHFKIVLNSVPIIGLPEAWGESEDWWIGYPAQREKLLSFIVDEGVENVWFLSGDLHVAIVARVERTGPARGIREILGGPAGPNGLNPLPEFAVDDPDLREQLVPPDQFLLARSRITSTRLTFDPDANDVRVEFFDTETGETLFDERLVSEA